LGREGNATRKGGLVQAVEESTLEGRKTSFAVSKEQTTTIRGDLAGRGGKKLRPNLGSVFQIDWEDPMTLKGKPSQSRSRQVKSRIFKKEERCVLAEAGCKVGRLMGKI